MRSAGAALVIGLMACGAPAPPAAPAPPPKPPVELASPEPPSARPSAPRPGERVRQPELDGYCAEAQRPAAFYYHGGNPAVRVARKDACAPLYLTECEAEGRCYPPRDQEPGMWCCSPADGDQPAAHATR